MISDSYIGRSGQAWKVWLSSGLAAIGFSMIMIALKEERSPDFLAILALAGTGLGVIGFLFACLAIRCRNCHAPLVWRAMKEQPHDKWLVWLVVNKNCPFCQHPGR